MKKFEELLQAELEILESVIGSGEEDEEGEGEAEDEWNDNTSFLKKSASATPKETSKDAASAQHQQDILGKVQAQVNTQEKQAKRGAVSKLIHAVGKHL